MRAPCSRAGGLGRLAIVVLALTAVVGSSMPSRSVAAAGSPGPEASARPRPSPTPKTMCESLADLALYVGFLREQSLDEDGLLPIIVGAVASLGEARTLLPLARATYRPLVDELVSAMDELLAVARAGRAGTLGTEVARLGEAVTRVGVAMDALSVALREPCPSAAPGASAVSIASPSTTP